MTESIKMGQFWPKIPVKDNETLLLGRSGGVTIHPGIEGGI